MKADDLKTKTPDELKSLLIDLKKKQFNMRFQRSQGQLENTSQIRATRRDIARVKTFMNPAAVKSASAPKKEKAPKAKKETKTESTKAEKTEAKAPAKKAAKKPTKKSAA
jgi:large subunit ribosomal protein L29